MTHFGPHFMKSFLLSSSAAHSKTHIFTIFCITSILISTLHHEANGVILAGVTIPSPPFVMTEGNEFRGLCIDLMKEIQKRSGLSYSLYIVNDGQYGPGAMRDGTMRGMIADVNQKKADFAIADMTVTTFREKFVKFTDPFFTFSFSALVRRELAANLHNLDDLAIRSNLSIGAYDGGSTLSSMQRLRKDVRTIRWLYNRIVADDSNLVHTRHEAMAKIRAERFAFMQEEPKNRYAANSDCSLKMLPDPHLYSYGRYALAFPHDSPYFALINKTIVQLEREGFLARLKTRYFANRCERNLAHNPRSANSILVWIFFSLTITQIISRTLWRVA